MILARVRVEFGKTQSCAVGTYIMLLFFWLVL